MSEKEELEKGVAESRARQQSDELVKYLRELSDRTYETLKKSLRADILFLSSLLAYFILTLLAYSLHLSKEMQEFVQQSAQLVEFFCLAYSWYQTRQWGNARSEYDGCVKTLRILGMLPPDGDKQIRNKQPMWEKGIQAVERWTAEKKANWGKGLGIVPA